MLTNGYICHGCRLSALLPVSTFGRTVLDTGTGRADRNVDSVRDGYTILISRGGGHMHSPHRKVEGLVLSVLIIYSIPTHLAYR